jgi:putative endonuclease
MKKAKFGILAEYITAFIYILKFYRILHHRLGSYVGEVDLIAKRGLQLVFIEVKARKNGITENIVSLKQQQRIRRAAKLYISQNTQYQNYNIRFDLVVISPYKIPIIIKNAW